MAKNFFQKLRLSFHKNKHESEVWNQSSFFLGIQKGTLDDAVFYEGKTANLVVATTKSGKKVGAVLSKADADGKVTIITSYEEEVPGYWDNQAKNW